MRIFKKKQNREEKVEIVVPKVPETEKLETPVVTKEEVKEEKKTTRTTARKKNAVKTVCRVLVATPSYFVIDKNGEQITVQGNNNYHRNEEILY